MNVNQTKLRAIQIKFSNPIFTRLLINTKLILFLIVFWSIKEIAYNFAQKEYDY